MTDPVNRSENVSPNTSISWNAVEGARGYFLLVGTTIGGRDLIDRLDVGNVLTYQPLEPFPENTVIYVKITVYFFEGPDNTCQSDRFTTGLLDSNTEDCTHVINPVPNYYACDYDLDGSEKFDIDIEALEDQLLGDQIGLEIGYYDIGGNLLSLADDDLQTFENERTIVARAIDSEGCYKEITFQLILVEPPVLPEISDVVECEFYLLPDLPDSDYTYFTEASGVGTELFAGDRISKSQTVYIYAVSEHCMAETNFKVTIEPEICMEPDNPEDMVLPNFFTPNGDGINDFWPIGDFGSTEIESIHIFDRYGALVFQIVENKRTWDGNLNGNPLPSSTYWYIALHESGKESRGYFSLKR